MFRTRVILLALAATVVLAPMGLGQGLTPNALVNGGFELFIPPQVGNVAETAGLNDCMGIGHQAFFGTETVPGQATGGTAGDPDPAQADPAAAVMLVAEDPEREARWVTGLDNCVASDEEGVDLAWITPSQFLQDDAVHWSNLDATVYGDHDGDGDREAAILSGNVAHHNMWQAYPSPFQAYTADFSAVAFDLEDGSIADGASIKVSLSANGLAVQNDRAVLYLDCDLTFRGEDLAASVQDGRVSMSPVDASFRSRHATCDPLEQAWNDATTAEEKRAVLAQTRIVQFSFWGFEDAPADASCGCAIQIDNVAIENPASVAESAAMGNLAVNPQVDPGDPLE